MRRPSDGGWKSAWRLRQRVAAHELVPRGLRRDGVVLAQHVRVGRFQRSRVALPVTAALTVADGLTGFGYHVRGIARKPGGWRIPVVNLVMGPPLLAPVLFAVSGYLGLATPGQEGTH